MSVPDHAVHLAETFLKTAYGDLRDTERRVVSGIARRVHITRDVNAAYDEKLTFGPRLADKVSKFGGSWTFITLFLVFLLLWVLVNAVVLASRAFDPYPFVFLNLILSMIAALQAPIIMISQNRQAAKDRLAAEHDYEVNLKAELEIMALHDKLDRLRSEQLEKLVLQQNEQLRILAELVEARR